MYKPQNTKLKYQGFTLIEIAVVLIIISLLLGGLVTPLTAQIDQRNFNETQKQLNEIKEALIGYALSRPVGSQPYLPCPDTDGDGQENRLGAGCVQDFGQIPTQSLGLKSVDAWNNQFVYRVATTFSNTAGFSLTSTGNINVLNAAGGANVVTQVPALILSTGKNGIPPAGNLDEVANTDGDPNFVSHEFTPTYDDMVVWVSPNILFNRLVTAGKLP